MAELRIRNIPEETARRFKSCCALAGKTQQEVHLELMKAWIARQEGDITKA